MNANDGLILFHKILRDGVRYYQISIDTHVHIQVYLIDW